MMTVKDDLIAAKALIADAAHWMQDDYSNIRGPDEVMCYCALGACLKVDGLHGGDEEISPTCLALAKVVKPGEPYWVARFNDDHTHAEVLALFDRAIEAAS